MALGCIVLAKHPPGSSSIGFKDLYSREEQANIGKWCISSISMKNGARQSLSNTLATHQISACSNNQYGAVLLLLHSFWTACVAAIAGSNAMRWGTYSLVLFDDTITTPVVNDFASTLDQLLNTFLCFGTSCGTNFTLSIQ